jgi:hypothetical protein
MAVHQVHSLPEYIRLIRKDPSEARALFSDLIINVTSFFRDPSGFEVLERKVIGPLVENSEPDEMIRVWVPACASGEEAYSIGMLFLEHMERAGMRKKAQDLRFGHQPGKHRDSQGAGSTRKTSPRTSPRTGWPGLFQAEGRKSHSGRAFAAKHFQATDSQAESADQLDPGIARTWGTSCSQSG